MKQKDNTNFDRSSNNYNTVSNHTNITIRQFSMKQVLAVKTNQACAATRATLEARGDERFIE